MNKFRHMQQNASCAQWLKIWSCGEVETVLLSTQFSILIGLQK